MGKLEQGAARRRRRNNIQQTVLGVIAVAGVISVTMIAPNVFQALPHLMGRQNYRLRFQTKTALGRLIVKGLVKKDSRGRFEVTEKGRRFLAIEEAMVHNSASAKRRWDKQYRLRMFDNPQTRRRTQDRLRELMTAFGFLRLQDSVWVSPYDCEDLIALVKAELKVGKDVLYAVVTEIENDGFIRQRF